MGVIDKLLAFFVFAPPLYMLFRFVRWWFKQEAMPEQEEVAQKTEVE